eukprot:jgi/Tetstr1/454248/TSEL_041167.t1
MPSRYGLILEALAICFSGVVSEGDYEAILRCLRAYEADREPCDQEVGELRRVGFPERYDPIHQMRNLYWTCRFGGPDRDDIKRIVGEFERVTAIRACAAGKRPSEAPAPKTAPAAALEQAAPLLPPPPPGTMYVLRNVGDALHIYSAPRTGG